MTVTIERDPPWRRQETRRDRASLHATSPEVQHESRCPTNRRERMMRAGAVLPAPSATNACRGLGDPNPDDLGDELGGDAGVGPKADGRLPGQVRRQLRPERLPDRPARREEAVVEPVRGERHEEPTVARERRHLVRDRLLRLGGGGPDRLPKLLPNRAPVIRERCHVLVDGAWCDHALPLGAWRFPANHHMSDEKGTRTASRFRTASRARATWATASMSASPACASACS